MKSCHPYRRTVELPRKDSFLLIATTTGPPNLYKVETEPGLLITLTTEMAKNKTRKKLAAATDLKDANHDQKMKTNQFPTRWEKRRDLGDLRKEMFNKKKGEEELSKGMTIRNIFLRDQGFDVKEDEDNSEKYEIDAYKHAKKVQNGELRKFLTQVGRHRLGASASAAITPSEQ